MAVEKTLPQKSSIRSRILAEVRNKDLEIPTLPESNARLEMISEQEVIDIKKFTGVLAGDPGVASQLIQVANSAPYAGQRSVGSIGVAIKRLGLRYAAELAAGLASRQVFQPTNEMIERRYRLAVADATFVAAAAAVFARNYTEISPERARLAGLVHNLGVFPILAQAEYENYTDTFALGTIVEAVQVVLSSTLLTRLKFPKEVAEIPRRISEHQRTSAELGLLDLVAVAVRLNRCFNRSESDDQNSEIRVATVRRPKISQSLAMLIYEIAGYDPLANAGQVMLLQDEINSEIGDWKVRET